MKKTLFILLVGLVNQLPAMNKENSDAPNSAQQSQNVQHDLQALVAAARHIMHSAPFIQIRQMVSVQSGPTGMDFEVKKAAKSSDEMD